MQVANTLNNNIRILFNPRIEKFTLFDFLLVKSDDNSYLAQIVEIYDDKFDASQNVAKLKLFYKITQNNEVAPYDGFTPNKECEIHKLKQDEIEAFINNDKKTFPFATNSKTSSALNVQYDFFNNNPIVLADKMEHACAISLNLAKNLSNEKNAIIIDTTGIVEFEEAKKIKATVDFKMPLNATTIDYIFENCLSDASLEFQAIGGEIISEIKRFAKKQELGFIPFNSFVRVLLDQYEATPYPELKVLLSRLKHNQINDIFAKTKKDNENLFKNIEKNKITILDLSSLNSFWIKAYLEYIVNDIEQEIYLIARVNDENCDTDLINKIYTQKKNIKFVPNASYNYKKLPTVVQYCKNYVLLPSLYQRNDFLNANFALSNLLQDSCIVFGENTDNFLYLARDWELGQQEKRKNYRKIALSLIEEDEKNAQNILGEKGDYFENEKKNYANNLSDSEILMKELADFGAKAKVQDEIQEEKEEEFEQIENPNIVVQNQENIEESAEENDIFLNDEEDILNENIKTEAQDDFDVLDNQEQEEVIEQEEEPAQEVQEVQEIQQESVQEIMQEQIAQQEEIVEQEEDIDFSEEELDFFQLARESSTQFEQEEQQPLEENEPQKSSIKDFDLELTEIGEEQQQEPVQEVKAVQEENEEQEEQALEELFLEEQEEIEEDEETEEELDLKAVADDSVEQNFQDIIDSKKEVKGEELEVDKNTTINVSSLEIEQKEQKEDLPIFKEELPTDTVRYSVGNVIVHNKYGRGTIVKTIKYEERQLLQIEFENAGKKLLDPKVADIKPE